MRVQPACRGLGYAEGALPQTELAASQILSLPMYPELSERQLNYVADALRESVIVQQNVVRS